MLKKNDWFTIFKSNPNALVRLFCFHYAGGSASAFREWVKDISACTEIIAVQLPGREDRYSHPSLDNIFAIVDKLYFNIHNYLNLPFVFFGHSMGGLIAFELIRKLRKHGSFQPRHLIIGGTRAPHTSLGRKPTHRLRDDDFIKELKKYNGISPSILEDEDLISIFLPTIRSDFYVSETYQYNTEKALNCPITALGGIEDNTFETENLLEWSKQTTGIFKHHLLQGDHFFIKTSYKEVIRIINHIISSIVISV